jgi:hypothetical protein
MSKIVKLTESDLNRIVKKVMNEAPITGQGGVRPNPANVTGQGGVGGVRPNPANVTGQVAGGGVRPNPANVTGQGGVGGVRPKPVSGTSQGGGVRPNPANVTGQSGTSGPNAMVNVNLVIDCKRRVIQKTDISLLQQGNSMVINAFCTPSYRKPTGGK